MYTKFCKFHKLQQDLTLTKHFSHEDIRPEAVVIIRVFWRVSYSHFPRSPGFHIFRSRRQSRMFDCSIYHRRILKPWLYFVCYCVLFLINQWNISYSLFYSIHMREVTEYYSKISSNCHMRHSHIVGFYILYCYCIYFIVSI